MAVGYLKRITVRDTMSLKTELPVKLKFHGNSFLVASL